MNMALSKNRRLISATVLVMMILAFAFGSAVEVKAASSDSRWLVKDPYSLRPTTETFYVKGSWWWFVQKDVKLDVNLALYQGLRITNSKTNAQILKWYQEHSKFNVSVYKEDGKTLWKSYSNLSYGKSFKIPGGSGNYKVVVTAKIDSTKQDFQRNGFAAYTFARFKLIY